MQSGIFSGCANIQDEHGLALFDQAAAIGDGDQI
jgi:hypothetical protein